MNNKFLVMIVLLLSNVAYAMENDALQSIQDWQDIRPFAGKVVVYTAAAYYLDRTSHLKSESYGYELSTSNLSCGYVGTYLHHWNNREKGYQLYQLLKKRAVDINTALVNEYINESGLYMRDLTVQESKEIVKVLTAKKARFSSMYKEEERAIILQLKSMAQEQ